MRRAIRANEIKVPGKSRRLLFIISRDRGLYKRKADIAMIKESRYNIMQNGQKLFKMNKEMLNIMREAIAEVIVKTLRVKLIRLGDSDHPKISKRDRRAIMKWVAKPQFERGRPANSE